MKKKSSNKHSVTPLCVCPFGQSCVRNSTKLFQQLLVAPAALGLMATGVNAAELNITGVSDYAASADQVTSVTQFSDVTPPTRPIGLAGLVETYGCVKHPNGTFRGNCAMTRFEGLFC